MKPFLPLSFLLTDSLQKYSQINPLLSGSMGNLQTILSFAPLVVLFGQILGLSIPLNFNSVPKNVYSLGIAIYTKDSNA
jgi:hypothetical protein